MKLEESLLHSGSPSGSWWIKEEKSLHVCCEVSCSRVEFFFLCFKHFASGGARGISGAGGVTDAVNSSSTASLIFINSCSCSSADLCLLPRWKILSSKVILPKVSCMTPFRKLIMALDVAKNGLPSMMGTWLVPPCHQLRIKNYGVNRIIKFVHLHQNILNYAFWNFYRSIS